MASLADRCCTPHVYATACFAALTTGRQYSDHGALGGGHSAPGMSSATDCKSGPCVAGQDGTEIGDQAAEQLVGGDRCLTRQLVSDGSSHRRSLGPGSTALYVGLITRRSELRIHPPLAERRPQGRLICVLAMNAGIEPVTRRPQVPVCSDPGMWRLVQPT
jgi:hypothetical protein